jgi:predicted nucleic acid-binding protein
MKIALDTNVLAYAEGTNGAPMRGKALDLMERLPVGNATAPLRGAHQGG